MGGRSEIHALMEEARPRQLALGFIKEIPHTHTNTEKRKGIPDSHRLFLYFVKSATEDMPISLFYKLFSDNCSK